MQHISNIFTASKKNKILIIISMMIVFFGYVSFAFVNASPVTDLQNKINTKNDEIKRLQDEIKAYESSLDKTAAQAKTLKNELSSLTLSKSKLEKELTLTQKNLEKTTATIGTIVTKISTTESQIESKKNTIGANIRDVRLVEDISPLENILASKKLSDVADYIDQTSKLTAQIAEAIRGLKDLEESLSGQKDQQETKKSELKKLQTNLSGQKKAVADTAFETDKLLKVTKNQESNYQKILDEKKKQQAKFESELFEYESQLKIAIDPSKLPAFKSGVLSWPLAKVRLTQMFGKTSTSGRLYASGTHNGIDLAASDGTLVMASLSGTVTATGNTDSKSGCYSYGKWVLLKHNNGLSTLYGHLSSISVNPGDSVITGDGIGYSGHTGYVTGPHLHLTVLATEGVRVTPIPTATPCNGVMIPIGDPKAFLDPILYLPPL